MTSQFTHLDEFGSAHMVDVSAKAENERIAIAKGEVVMKKETLEQVRSSAIKKGDVLTVAQIAGIAGAKRTSELIPLCHPLPITHADVVLLLDDSLPGVTITATVKTTGKTGVEMEAMTGASVAALTVYDMCKAMNKAIRIEDLHLVSKTGGKSGDYHSNPQ